MPIVGLGLHFLIAIFCAVHAVRTRQPNYWLYILFGFPLLGSIVYFLAIYLPNSRLERAALKAVSAAAHAIDPGREVREARIVLEEAPTARNQMRLAAALIEAGDAAEAARLYEACMTGPFANEPEFRLGAARAFTECQRYAQALEHLETLRRERPDFKPEVVSLLLARCFAGTSRAADARAQFQSAEREFATYEAKAEYAIWALAMGDKQTAERLDVELQKIASRWNPLARQLNERIFIKYQKAKKLAAAQ